jgi:hypothetical protein
MLPIGLFGGFARWQCGVVQMFGCLDASFVSSIRTLGSAANSSTPFLREASQSCCRLSADVVGCGWVGRRHGVVKRRSSRARPGTRRGGAHRSSGSQTPMMSLI